MAEVIDLLSSPEKTRSPRRTTAPTPVPQHRPMKTHSHARNLSFDSDDSLFDYCDVDEPRKKRRLTPLSQSSPNKKITPVCSHSANPFRQDDDKVSLSPDEPRRLGRPTIDELLGRDEDSDPIQFTSSAVDPLTAHNRPEPERRRDDVIVLDDTILSDDNNDDYDLMFSQPAVPQAHVSDRTASLLARIGNAAKNDSSHGRDKYEIKIGAGREGSKRKSRRPSTPGSDEDSAEEIKPKKGSKAPSASQHARAAEREAARIQKAKEKEEEKERKRKLKEQKAKEKQLAADIAEVNKSKIDKKVSTPEMIIDVSSSLEESSVGNQVTEFMRHLGVQMAFTTTRVPNMVTWRRKVTARYNEEAGHWEPAPLTIKREQHVLCLVTGQELVDMALATQSKGENSVESHVAKIMSSYPDCKPIYLIEGLTAWMRKNKNSRNRAYQAAVLREFNNANASAQPQPTQSKRSKKSASNPSPPVDDDTIEDALLQLQVQHGCLIHHTAAPAESAEWIKNFTEHISTIPYRRERMNLQNAAFCMDVGQVKTGEDKADTFVKMLQEVHRVTASVAYGISAEYPSVRELTDAMKRRGPALLEDVKVSWACYSCLITFFALHCNFS